MVKCPSCYQMNDPGSTVCTECGAKLGQQRDSVEVQYIFETQTDDVADHQLTTADEPFQPTDDIYTQAEDPGTPADEAPLNNALPSMDLAAEDEEADETVFDRNELFRTEQAQPLYAGYCDHCNGGLPGYGDFCPHCAYPLSGDYDRRCQQCATLLIPEAMFCHHCGEEAPIHKAILHLILENDATHTYALDNHAHEYIVGRTSRSQGEVDLDLDPLGGQDMGVSRRHARLVYDSEDGQWLLTDFDSTYGTFIDNEQLHPEIDMSVEHGHVVKFGGIAFRVVIE